MQPASQLASPPVHAHIRLKSKTIAISNDKQVKSVKLAKSKPKTGDYDLYATRFFDDSGKMMLSCLLHGKQGAYAPGAVEAWQGLQAKYGEAVDFNGPE